MGIAMTAKDTVLGLFGRIASKQTGKHGQDEQEALAQLKDKVILITGAGGGIAAEVTPYLAQAGAKLVLADMDNTALATRAGMLLGAFPGSTPLMDKDNLRTVILDVTVPEGCEDAANYAVQEFGRLDIAWVNAGIAPFCSMEVQDPNEWRKIIDINLLGAYNTIHGALPHIIASKGYFAIMSSWAALAHSPGHTAYAASKAGVEAMANALRVEVAHQGVDVGVYHPGWVGTRMVTDHQKDNNAFNILLKALPYPLGEVTSAEEIAPVLAEAMAKRTTRVVYPKVGWALYALRSLVPTRPLSWSTRKAAPKMLQATRAQEAAKRAG